MNIVVTGGAGFIGGNLCRALVQEPFVDRIVVIDDFSTGHPENLSDFQGIEVVAASVLDRRALTEVTRDASTIVHLAARPSVPRSLNDPEATHDVNATGTLRVLEAARSSGSPHVIVASSSSVYGTNLRIPKSEDMEPMPASPYAASKLATESYALAYSRAFGLRVLAFRFFNVFGPLQDPRHDYAAVVPTFVAAALSNHPLYIHGDGSQTRDFTYVGSAVSALVSAIREQVTFDGPVNLAFGTRVSLLELVATLERQVGYSLVRTHGEPRPGDVRHSQADTTRFSSLFPGLTPVPLDEGLRRTMSWMRELVAKGTR